VRPKSWLALTAGVGLSVALATATAAAQSSKPVIKGAEVGYFGGALVTHQLSVFVYLAGGPSAGNHVTVCLGRVCKQAHGHNAKLAWYSASFKVRRGLHMGDSVTFAAVASNGTRRERIKVTGPLLCMHNDGSTPQT
jgi:hypothetical protein